MLIVLMGSSSVGKDSVQNLISEKWNIPICVSSTSRPMRLGESEGKQYYFISEDKFLENYKNNKFVEFRVYETAAGKWYYGLSKDSVDIDITQLVIVDQQGYYSLVEAFGQDNIVGILLTAPERVKIQRALDREDRNDKVFFEELYRRMGDDLYAFDKVEMDLNVFNLKNENLKVAVFNIMNLLKDKGVIANG